MTIALLLGGVVVFGLLAAVSARLINRGGAEPAARAVGRAPDPREEREARRSARDHERKGREAAVR